MFPMVIHCEAPTVTVCHRPHTQTGTWHWHSRLLVRHISVVCCRLTQTVQCSAGSAPHHHHSVVWVIGSTSAHSEITKFDTEIALHTGTTHNKWEES